MLSRFHVARALIRGAWDEVRDNGERADLRFHDTARVYSSASAYHTRDKCQEADDDNVEDEYGLRVAAIVRASGRGFTAKTRRVLRWGCTAATSRSMTARKLVSCSKERQPGAEVE